MLESFHVNAPATEADALGLQQEALLHRQFAAQRYPAARTQDPLPRQTIHLLQNLGDVPRTPWVPRGFRDRAVGADSASRYLPDGSADRWGQPQDSGLAPLLRPFTGC